jgi:hypothetical protein
MKTEVSIEVRNSLRAARESLGWSQDYLRQRAGLSLNAVKNFETNKSTSQPTHLRIRDAIKKGMEERGMPAEPCIPTTIMGIARWTGPDLSQPQSISQFLPPRHATLTLHDRTHELASLQGWLDAKEVISVRVLVGESGIGKTRLAVELLHQMSTTRPDWHLGVLTAVNLARLEKMTADELKWDKPTLFVIDSVKTCSQSLGRFLTSLSQLEIRNRFRLRLLLLERSGGKWLTELLGAGENDELSKGAAASLFNPPHPIAVPPLSITARHAMLVDAITAIERLEQRSIDKDCLFSEATKAILAQPRFGIPLQIALTALAAQNIGLAEALTRPLLDIALIAAQRERVRLRAMAPLSASSLQSEAVSWIAACITLQCSADPDELSRVVSEELQALRIEWPGGRGDLEHLLAEALPESHNYVGPLELEYASGAFVLFELGLSGARKSKEKSWEAIVLRCADRSGLGTAIVLLRIWQDFGHDPRCTDLILRAIDAFIGVGRNGAFAALLTLLIADPGYYYGWCTYEIAAIKVATFFYNFICENPQAFSFSSESREDLDSIRNNVRTLTAIADRLSSDGRHADAVNIIGRTLIPLEWITDKIDGALSECVYAALNNVSVFSLRAKGTEAARRVLSQSIPYGRQAAGLIRALVPAQINLLRSAIESGFHPSLESQRYCEEAHRLYKSIGGRKCDSCERNWFGWLELLAIYRETVNDITGAFEAASEAEWLCRSEVRSNTSAYGVFACWRHMVELLIDIGRTVADEDMRRTAFEAEAFFWVKVWQDRIATRPAGEAVADLWQGIVLLELISGRNRVEFMKDLLDSYITLGNISMSQRSFRDACVAYARAEATIKEVAMDEVERVSRERELNTVYKLACKKAGISPSEMRGMPLVIGLPSDHPVS